MRQEAPMKKRTLTIRLTPDWKSGLRSAARKVQAKSYRGEELAFEAPAVFFGKLTERRWALVRTLQGKGTLSIRELARQVERDVKRVHEDVSVLLDLGLFERGEGGIACPFARIHVDFEVAASA
jgi:predicted transcriptional regulator